MQIDDYTPEEEIELSLELDDSAYEYLLELGVILAQEKIINHGGENELKRVERKVSRCA